MAGRTGFTAKIVETDNGYLGIQLTSEAGKDLRLINASATGNDLALEDLRAIDGDDGTPAGAVGTNPLAGNGNSTAWSGANSVWITGQVIEASGGSRI